jgi:hypothetical protein
MNRTKVLAFACVLFAVQSVSAQERPALFITPTADNFEVYLSAAMTKKRPARDSIGWAPTIAMVPKAGFQFLLHC